MNTWTEAERRPRTQPSPQRRRPKPRRSWGQRFLLGAGIFTSMSLTVMALGLLWGLQRFQAISRVNVPTVEAAPPGEPSNWLLVGSDSREGIDPDDPNAAIFLGEDDDYAGKRTDTIMVARIDPGARTVDLLSVPRDLWVPLAGSGENGRINGAFRGDGGETRLVSTVEDVLDIEINNYAEVNFVGFQAVIDALGGVPIWFDFAVRDEGSALNIDSPGCHILDGFQSLAFARSRHLEYYDEGEWKSDPTSDLGRNSRQQFLLSRLADRASSQVGFADFGTIDAIVRAGGENLLIDDGSGAGDLLGLARAFAGVGGEGVRSHALPVVDDETSGGAKILRLREDEAESTLEIFRGIEPPPDPSAFPSTEGAERGSFTVVVNNGAGISGLAAGAQADLEAVGFTIDSIGDAEPTTLTVIRYPVGMEGAATELGRVLTIAPQFEVDGTVDDLELVLGGDFDGINDATLAGATVTSAAPEVVAAAPVAPAAKPVGVVPGPGPEGTECYFPT